MQGRWSDLVAHRLDHLDQAGDSRGGDQMTGVRFQRPDRQIDTAAVHLRARVQFGCVTDRGAGRVALQQRDVGRFESGDVERLLHGAHLARPGWHQHPAAPAVVRQTDSTDDPVDRVAVGDRVVEAPQRDESAPLGRHEAIGFRMERPRPAAGTQCIQRRETLVDEQVVGAVDRSGQHEVGDAIVQSIAGQFDRVQAARTCRVQGERTGAQPECTFEQQRRKARHEAVARPGEVDLRFRDVDSEVTQGDGLHERCHARRGERQVAEHGAEPRRIGTVMAGVAERLSCGVERPSEDRIEGDDLIGGDLEPVRVEHRVEVVHVAATIRPGVVGTPVGAVAHHIGRGHLPAVLWHVGDQVIAGDDPFPEGTRRQCTG